MSDNLASADRMIRDLLADPENSSDFFQFALPDHVKSQLDLTKKNGLLQKAFLIRSI